MACCFFSAAGSSSVCCGEGQQQGVEAESPQIPGQLPQLAASLPVRQQDREPQIAVAVVPGEQHPLLVDLGAVRHPCQSPFCQ